MAGWQVTVTRCILAARTISCRQAANGNQPPPDYAAATAENQLTLVRGTASDDMAGHISIRQIPTQVLAAASPH